MTAHFCRAAVAGFAAGTIALSAAAGIATPPGSYKLDPEHGYITFSYSHMGFSTPHIGFTDFDVDLELNAQDPAASEVSVTIDARSIDSRVAVFNEHLNGERFFDTANHPTIKFVSRRIEMLGETSAAITGDLTIKGVTKPVVLQATLNKADLHPMKKKPVLGLNAQAQIKRSEWGLGYAVPAVGDDVTIYVTVELIKN